MDAEKIPLTTVFARLERIIHSPIEEKDFKNFLWWWRKHDPFAPSVYTLGMRRNRDGEEWLLRFELQRLSKFAGYNLCLENG